MKMAYPASGARFYCTELQCLRPVLLYSFEGTEDKPLEIWQNSNTWELY